MTPWLASQEIDQYEECHAGAQIDEHHAINDTNLAYIYILYYLIIFNPA